MNIHRAFEPRHMQPVMLTTAAYLDMAGFLNVRFEKTELLDGVVYEMAADGPLTRLWNSVISRWLFKSLPEDIAVVSHQTLPLGEFWAPSPDHYLFSASLGHENVSGMNALLVIEVSHTTLDYDLGGKADAYAEHGVAEYWVIDPNEKTIYVHRLNADGAYGEPVRHAASDLVEATRVSGLKLRLADFVELN